MGLITYPRTKGTHSTSTSSASAYQCGLVPVPSSLPVRLKHAIGLIQFDGWRYKPISWTKRPHKQRQQLRKEFNSVRKNFLKDLAKKKQSLLKSGFSQEDIEKMECGRLPFSYQVHHIMPLDDGGTNAFSNLVLIKTAIFHEAIHSSSQDYQKQINRLSPGDTINVNFPVTPSGCKIWPLNQSDPVKVILRLDEKAIKDRQRGLMRLKERGVTLHEKIIQ